MSGNEVNPDQSTGNVDMALRWIKSNWTVLAFLGGLAVYQVRNNNDTKHEFKNLNQDISEIKSTAAGRSQLADTFYRKVDDLAPRVANIEKAQEQLVRLFERSVERAETSNEALRKDLQGISIQVSVVSSKVDDLRQTSPRKTSFP